MHVPVCPRMIGLSLLGILLAASTLPAQDAAEQPAATKRELPEIPDDPRTVDPAQHVPPKLAVPVTIRFSDASLREVAQWIEEDQQMPVLLDRTALADEGIPPGEPVSEDLDGEPVYLLLNRLRSLGLAWFVEDDVLHITTQLTASQRLSTRPYNVGDLFDTDFKQAVLSHTIEYTTEGLWSDIDGEGGGYEWLGDVLFVRQSDSVHREVAGLLDALREHGRQTFTFDPPQHIPLRAKMNSNVSVNFVDTPLFAAVQELAEMTGADIRLDKPALRECGVRDREPVSLTLSDRKLNTVLHVLLADLQLTWILRDGVMWITSGHQAKEFSKTAVYDVRDLCRNEQESRELERAIDTQTQGPWEERDGEGGVIVFAKPGTLVIRHTETVHAEVENLLDAYRKALLSSKERKRGQIDPDELVTRYYRMHESIAADLVQMLPLLVQDGSWKDDSQPDAAGRIVKVSSEPQLLDPQGHVVHATLDSPNAGAFVFPQAVLIIRQTRAAHAEIAKVISRAQQGDPPEKDEPSSPGGGGGGGGFGGGFGGGYFLSR